MAAVCQIALLDWHASHPRAVQATYKIALSLNTGCTIAIFNNSDLAEGLHESICVSFPNHHVQYLCTAQQMPGRDIKCLPKAIPTAWNSSGRLFIISAQLPAS